MMKQTGTLIDTEVNGNNDSSQNEQLLHVARLPHY